jgi:predicted branched-subunit amino acid permease
MYVNWNLCTAIGILAGQQVEGLGQLGLDFAMVVTFTGIIVPLIIDRPMLICAVVAAVTAVLANELPNKLGLMLAAVLGIIAGFLVETWQINKGQAVPVKDAVT